MGWSLMKVLQILVVLALVAIALALANLRMQSSARGEPVGQRASSAKDTNPQQVTTQPAASPFASAAHKSRLVVAFRLDPHLTQGLYLGDRWVSPPTFSFAQPGKQYVVQAKMQAIDNRGERVDLSGDWTTDNSEMIAITRRDNGEVTIVVRQPGESNVTASAGGESKRLHVRARQTDDAMQVAITQ